MPLYVARTAAPQGPGKPSMAGGSIAPVPTLGNSAAAAVAGVGQQLAGRAADIYQQERDREIETRVRELDVQRRTADAEVLNGYRQALGKAAVDGRGEAMAAISSNSRRVREGIADREVAKVWGQQDARLTLAAQEELDGHYRQQNIKWQADTHEARADLLVSDLGRVAFGEGFDPATGRLSDEAERTRSAYRDELARLGGLMGWDASVTEKHVREADSAAFGQVAETLVRQGRFIEAQAVLEKHRERIEEGPRQQLLQAAREGQQRAAAAASRSAIADQSTRLAMSIPGEMVKEARAQRGALNQNDPIEDPRKSPSYVDDAKAKLDEMFSNGSITAEVRDATLERLGADATAYRQRDARETEVVMGQAEKWLVDNPNEPVTAMPPQLYVELERRGQLAAIRGFAQGRRYVTDPKALAAFDALPDAQLQTVSRGELRTQLRGFLDDTDLNYALAKHAKATGGAGDVERRILSVDDRLNEYLRKMRPTLRGSGAAEELKSEAVYNLKRNVVERLRALEAGPLQGKRPATDDELQRLFDDAVLDQVYVSDWGYDSRLPVGALTPEQQAAAYVVVGGEEIPVGKVPTAQRKLIEMALQRRGLPISEQAVVEMWVGGGRQQ